MWPLYENRQTATSYAAKGNGKKNVGWANKLAGERLVTDTQK